VEKEPLEQKMSKAKMGTWKATKELQLSRTQISSGKQGWKWAGESFQGI
jgi:hypothetical protein